MLHIISDFKIKHLFIINQLTYVKNVDVKTVTPSECLFYARVLKACYKLTSCHTEKKNNSNFHCPKIDILLYKKLQMVSSIFLLLVFKCWSRLFSCLLVLIIKIKNVVIMRHCMLSTYVVSLSFVMIV